MAQAKKGGGMQKVIDYKLVRSTSVDRLENNVKNSMAEGWVPSGIVVAFAESIVQAMVKFQETS